MEEIREAAKKLDQTLLRKLHDVKDSVSSLILVANYCDILQVVKQRPMWTRVALFNQFTFEEVKLLDRYVIPHPFQAGVETEPVHSARKHLYLSALTPFRTDLPESFLFRLGMILERIQKRTCTC